MALVREKEGCELTGGLGELKWPVGFFKEWQRSGGDWPLEEGVYEVKRRLLDWWAGVMIVRRLAGALNADYVQVSSEKERGC